MAKTSEKYEVMYILNPNLTEEETAALVEKFKVLVEQNGTLDEMEETDVMDILPDLSAPVLLYCRTGRRASLAAAKLDDLGYTKIYNLGGLMAGPMEWNTECCHELGAPRGVGALLSTDQ